jgi:hypothetical protein
MHKRVNQPANHIMMYTIYGSGFVQPADPLVDEQCVHLYG